MAYRKTGLEWEILGDLGLRLHHKEEAKEVCPMFCVPNPYSAHISVFSLSQAYQRCLDTPRYSQKPWAKLMDMYAEEGDIQRGIQTAIRVAAYQWADYTEMTVRFPHPLTSKKLTVIPLSYIVPNTNRPCLFQAWPNSRTR